MSKIWQKDDKSQLNRDWFDRFTTREDRSYDQYLITYDLLGNLAQAAILKQAGIYSQQEYDAVSQALKRYYRSWEMGEFQLEEHDEDVHSCVERHLIADCGEAGKRIHTGRSRNDQVATDVRLFLKHRMRELVGSWIRIFQVMGELGERYEGVFFAGMTHTQPAMPSSVDAWAAGWQDLMLADMRSVLGVYREVDRSPLGSAAGYGVPYFGLERGLAADLMGFSEVQWPVTAVQPGRGVLEKRVVDALGYAALTFNRLAADVILFVNPAFGYLRLSEDQTSGSSIMPQKRNPDAWELIRATYHRFSGISAELSSVGANLTSGYHRDLQVSKRAVMDAVFAAEELATAVERALRGVDVDVEACERSLTAEVFATHEANKLVSQGMPFREAYRLAAKMVSDAKVLVHDELKSSYLIKGSPGIMAKSSQSNQIGEILNWFETESTKQENKLHTLLH
ncbi:MAG: argininosuccinate lyase [Bacteroidetes bacterium]|nr:argininosuccinate lyase [Bacteroidota bacterium]